MENKDEHKKDADAHPHRGAERLVMAKHQPTNGAPENPDWLKLTCFTVGTWSHNEKFLQLKYWHGSVGCWSYYGEMLDQ